MSASYPPAYILEPTQKHENTLILLHGTSQDGTAFGDAFVNFAIAAGQDGDGGDKTFPQLFPSTRFVFPTGRNRFSTVLGRESHAWFDFESFSDRTQNEELQIEGLAESSGYLGALVDDEVALLMASKKSEARQDEEWGRSEEEERQEARRRIVVGGFSQGSAMACMTLLTGKLGGLDGGRIGAFVGLSGWCPFRVQILDAISKVEEGTQESRFRIAVHYVKGLLRLGSIEAEKVAFRRIPVFLGHGENDVKMKIHCGREMGELLEDIGCDVRFKAYRGLEHWWNPQEMKDLAGFLKGVWDVDNAREY